MRYGNDKSVKQTRLPDFLVHNEMGFSAYSGGYFLHRNSNFGTYSIENNIKLYFWYEIWINICVVYQKIYVSILQSI